MAILAKSAGSINSATDLFFCRKALPPPRLLPYLGEALISRIGDVRFRKFYGLGLSLFGLFDVADPPSIDLLREVFELFLRTGDYNLG